MSRSYLTGGVLVFVLLVTSIVHADDKKEGTGSKLPTVIRQEDDGWYDSSGATGSRVEKALGRPVTLDFRETPFQQVIEFLRDSTGLQIYLNPIAIDDLGIDVDQSISISLSEMPLRDVLDLLLSPLGLTYHAANNDLLLITDEDEPNTRVYPVVDILYSKSSNGATAAIVKEYRELIVETISSDTWSDNGGLGTIAFSPINSSFVITNSPRVHSRIERLLEDLRSASNATETWLQSKGPDAQKAQAALIRSFDEEAQRHRLAQEQRNRQQAQAPAAVSTSNAPVIIQPSPAPVEGKQTDSFRPVIDTLKTELKYLRDELSRFTGGDDEEDKRR